ncbi:MAG: hypothetical protein PHH69_03075 [Candidatus Omnitrophica bacterium]|nr:hypothetical protein [Candidatus Omnitrophota bacterium]
MQAHKLKIILFLLILLIIFSAYQSLRLGVASRQNKALKMQLNDVEIEKDLLKKELKEAGNTVGMLKQENERISALLSEAKAQRETDKQKAQELKGKVEVMLGPISPEGAKSGDAQK